MKPKVFVSLMLLILSTFLYVPNTTAENEPYTQWGLPEGAKARLGKGEINDITCTQDGALLAVASQIGIWIYDVQTSEALALLTEHTGRINSIAFSPDGNTLASGSHDNTVRLWDVGTRTEIGTLEGHTGDIYSVSFSPDGRTLVSWGDDNLRLWDVGTQTQIHALEGHTGSVESVAFSPDGKTIAIGGQDDVVRLWDVAMRTEIGTLEGHTDYVSSVSFSPDGKTIASGGHDNIVRLWNVAMRTEIGTLEGHTSNWLRRGIYSVSFSPDGKTIASGGYGDMRLWDVGTQTGIAIHEGPSSDVTGVSFSPNGQTIAYKVGKKDYISYVGIWNINTQKRIGGYTFKPKHTWDVLWVVAAHIKENGWDIFSTIFEEHTDDRQGRGINSVSFSPDGKTIASGGWDHGTFLWNVGTQTKIGTLDTWGTYSVSFSPDGKTIASAGPSSGFSNVRLWDVDTQTKIGTILIQRVNSVVFSPDGKTIASAGGWGDFYYNIVRLWDVGTQTEIGRHWEHIGDVNSVSFSPDGRTLASAGSIDSTVRLWDVGTWTEIAVLRGHTGWVNSVSFSPDGKTIASGSNDRTVRLWDVGTQTEISTLEGHTENVNSVSFSPDGHILASGSDDNTVRLWDARVEIDTLEGHIAAVNSVVFSPDGRILASGSDDGTVLLWDIAEIEATSLLLGGFLTAKIDPGNDVDYFNVQVEEFGHLTLWTTTTDPLDTIYTLQDSEGITFATNANNNVDAALNFRIEQYMYPGTYYIKVQSADQKTGDYTIYAAFIPATDVNKDGVVDVLDLMIVAENFGISDAIPAQGDVNGDGEVNREDINAVLDVLDAAAAAPAAVPATESLQRWIDRAKQLNRTDARFQKGIAVLQHLLMTLSEPVPKTTALLANYPNPFNPETWIPYQLAKPANVTLTIYSVEGALVRTLAIGYQAAGPYHSRNRAAFWDGRNAFGEPVASGVYFYTLTAGDFTATRKLLIRK